MAETTTSTATTTRARTRDRGFLALMLLTAGALVLAGRVFPLAGEALALVLGIELLAWAWVAKSDGPLVGGGVTVGVGTGILLAAGPLEGGAPHVIGGAFVLAIAGGFAVIALLSPLWLGVQQRWAWITAAATGIVGGALLAGVGVLSDLLSWVLPAALLVAGVIAAIMGLMRR